MSKPLIVIRPGWVDDKTKAAMTRAGYLVVEAPEGQEVKVIQPVSASDLIPADEFTTDLLESLAQYSSDNTVRYIGAGLISRLSKSARRKLESSSPTQGKEGNRD